MNDHPEIVEAGDGTSRESSVRQARWLLIPLFGLWGVLSVAGVVLG